MPRKFSPISAVIAACLSVLSPASCGPNDVTGRIEWQERTRSYFVHVPRKFRIDVKHPLVLVLHGGGGNAAGIAQLTGFNDVADREGCIAVYPNGTGIFRDRLLTWNSGNCCGYALRNEVDDVGFLRALVEKLKGEYPVDAKCIYATGMSNGAMMAFRLAAEASDVFAAVAPVAGAFNLDDPKPSHPVSVIMFNGDADQHVRYEGGAPHKTADYQNPRVDKPVSYAVSFWVKNNGCGPKPERSEKGSIGRDTYSSGKDGAEVLLYTIKGGGHAWPGGPPGRGGGDVPTKEISATDLMWEFFKAHPKISAQTQNKEP